MLGNYTVSEFIGSSPGLSNPSGIDFFPHEVCDPVENSAYLVNGLFMQDFVLPSYWVSNLKQGPFDFMDTVPAPFTPFKGEQNFIEFGCSEAESFTLTSTLSDPTTVTTTDNGPIFTCPGKVKGKVPQNLHAITQILNK